MKYFIPVCIASLIFIGCDMNKAKPDLRSTTSELLSLERKWLEAEFALDTTSLLSLLDPGFIGISEEGIKNKSQDITSMYNNIKQRLQDSIFIDSFKLEQPLVNVYENAAVVTFIVHSFGKNKTMPRQKLTRFYDVWIRKQGSWKAVSSQGTAL